MNKKLLCVICALVLSLSVFSGCKVNNLTKDDLGEFEMIDGVKYYELVMYDHGFTLPEKPEHREEVMNAINDKFYKEFGYKLKLTVRCFGDDQFETKINTELASGTKIDLIRIGARETLANYVNQEMLIDLTDTVKDKKAMNDYLLGKHPDIWMETSVDNRIYGIPGPAFTCYRGSWVRGDYLVKAGIKNADNTPKVPTTFAELEAALKAFKDNKVFDGRKPVSWAILLDELEGLILGNFTNTPGDYLDAKGNIQPKFMNSGYKNFIKKVNEWYKAGYLDDQLFNATYDGVAGLLRDGNTAIAGSNIWGLEWGTLNAINKANPDMQIKFLGYLEDSLMNVAPGVATDIYVIPYTSKNYKVMVNFLNWALYDKTNYSLVVNGIENVTYVKDDKGNIDIPDSYKGKPGISSPQNIMGKFAVGGNAEWNVEWGAKNTPAEATKAYKASMSMPGTKIYIPPTSYTLIQLDDFIQMEKGNADTNQRTALQAIIKNKEATDDGFEAAYNAMIAKYEKDGGMKAYAEYTKAYKKLNFAK